MNKNTKRDEIGWYGETLNAVLDRKMPLQAPAKVGYDQADLAKLLG